MVTVIWAIISKASPWKEKNNGKNCRDLYISSIPSFMNDYCMYLYTLDDVRLFIIFLFLLFSISHCWSFTCDCNCGKIRLELYMWERRSQMWVYVLIFVLLSSISHSFTTSYSHFWANNKYFAESCKKWELHNLLTHMPTTFFL